MRPTLMKIWTTLFVLFILCIFIFAFALSYLHVRAIQQSSNSADTYGFGLHGSLNPVPGNSPLYPNSLAPNTSVVDALNWTGLFVGSGSGSGFKQVTGNWNTPCTSGPIDSNHAAAQWVGLGGVYGNQNLLQVGTVLLGDGRFHVFYELYPNPPVIMSQSFSCANAFTAEVDYNFYSTGTYKNHVYIQNTTTGYILNYTINDSQFKPDMQSAEWIDERPGCSSGLTDLANFHYVDWTSTQARSNTSTAVLSPFTSFPNNIVIMQDTSQHLLAKPDSLASNNAFKDRWYGTGTDGQC